MNFCKIRKLLQNLINISTNFCNLTQIEGVSLFEKLCKIYHFTKLPRTACLLTQNLHIYICTKIRVNFISQEDPIRFSRVRNIFRILQLYVIHKEKKRSEFNFASHTCLILSSASPIFRPCRPSSFL